MTEEEVLKLARERYEQGVTADRDNIAAALEDLEFRAGNQWDDEARQLRKDAGRPCLEINLLPQFIRQVTGDIRINKPSIKVRPVDSGADPEVAETYTGLIRHIENISDAQSAYTKAADASATCGIGHFQVVTDYLDPESFDQEIFIEGIANPLSVVWDPASVKPTREDANWCFVHEEIPLEDFKAKYPKASMTPFEGDMVTDDVRSWKTGDTIRIADYWCKKEVSKEIGRTPDGRIIDMKGIEDPEMFGITTTRKVKTTKVVHYVINGAEILEGPDDWAGRHIPIVPVIGEEVHVGDKVVRHGLVRFAKDSQRMFNFERSAATESIASQPKAPYLVTPQMIKGHEPEWAALNQGNPPYLTYNTDPNGSGPKREFPAPMPAAQMQAAGIAAEDLQRVTGIYASSLGASSNETSGKAILSREKQGDVGTFVYVDNLARAIRHCGRILIDLIPKIYDTERQVRILGEDEKEKFVAINQVMQTPYGPVVVNDLSVGRYDVVVETGPSYSTRRAEASESMMAFIQSAPDMAGIVMDQLAKNFDWPGAEEIAKRLRKIAVQKGIAEPEEGEEPPQPPPPDPRIEGEMMEMKAKIEKMMAETEGQKLENAQSALQMAVATGQLQELVQIELQKLLQQPGIS